MTADEARGTRWSDLVDGLLDARADPATARFDAELAAAVAAGELSARTAQRLRFWQRAAVSGADDHARTVVPAVLGVLVAARSEAQAHVEQGRASLDAADDAAGHHAVRRTPDTDLAAALVTTPDVLADRTFRLAAPEWPRPVPGLPATAAQQAEAPPSLPSPDDNARRASTPVAEEPSTLEEPAPRVFVADLRDVPAPTARV